PVMQFIGTIAGGPIGDRLNKRWLVIVCMRMHALGMVIFSHATTLGMVIAFMLLHGLARGLGAQQRVALRADYFGRTSFGKVVGVSNTTAIVGTSAGPLIAGLLYDQTGAYRIGVGVLAGIAALGSVFFLLAVRPARP